MKLIDLFEDFFEIYNVTPKDKAELLSRLNLWRDEATVTERQKKFLELYGDSFLWFENGCVVVETYYDRKFREMGGNTDRLISLFEDFGNIREAVIHYFD